MLKNEQSQFTTKKVREDKDGKFIKLNLYLPERARRQKMPKR